MPALAQCPRDKTKRPPGIGYRLAKRGVPVINRHHCPSLGCPGEGRGLIVRRASAADSRRGGYNSIDQDGKRTAVRAGISRTISGLGRQRVTTIRQRGDRDRVRAVAPCGCLANGRDSVIDGHRRIRLCRAGQ